MEVVLINHTPEPLRTIYTAARTCYAAGTPASMWKASVSEEAMAALIRKTIGSGHFSVAEHVTFVFAISGISRACSHQLVRHRIASFSQQSQRYVALKQQPEFVMPVSIEKNEQARLIFTELMKSSTSAYLQLVELGIAAEDARSVLANACPTNLVMTMNLRELIHASSVRLCIRAQREIRTLFDKIAVEVKRVEPLIGQYLVPKCESLGFCDEDASLSCGLYPTFEEARK